MSGPRTGPRAVILLAHGSRDPSWPAPIEAVAQAMRAAEPATPVACAYLEWTLPALPAAVQAAVDGGARHITLVPMFLGLGRHTRQDMPRLAAEMQAAHPGVVFVTQAAISEDPRMVELMARIALE